MLNPHILDLRIDWSEIDSFQHVNNVAFFKYAQAARVALCDSVGIAVDSSDSKPGFMVAKTECEFLEPLNYPGTIQIKSAIGAVGNTSFQITHHIYNDQNTLSARLNDVLVLFDFMEHQKVTISESLKRLLLDIA